MIQEIKFNGYTTSPSDYECPDGSLAAAISVIQEDNGLHTLHQPALKLQLSIGEAIVLVHKTMAYEHYIIHNTRDNSVRWIDADDYNAGGDIRDFADDLEIYQFKTIGNTLLVLSKAGIQYFLWNASGYEYLGTHLPELPISFGLKAEAVRQAYNITGEYIIWSDGYVNTSYRDGFWGEVNKFITKYTKKHKFLMPFFVRYAYRLYDGSVIMASAPIFMPCTSGAMPHIFLRSYGNQQSYVNTDLFAPVHTLDFAVTRQDAIDMLKKWKDIVVSVDIFISKPIYFFDINSKDIKWHVAGGNNRLDNIWTVAKRTTNVGTYAARPANCFPAQYQKISMFDLYDLSWPDSWTTPQVGDWWIEMPTRPAVDVENDIRSCHDFYFLTAIELDQLSTTRADVPMPSEEEYMITESLVQKERLDTSNLNDYKSHDTVVPQVSYVYNNRLNLVNVSRKLFYGYFMEAQLPYTDGFVRNAPHYENNQHHSDLSLAWNSQRKNIKYFVHIREEDEREYVVCYTQYLVENRLSGASYGRFGARTPINYIFYPNRRAYKVTVEEYASQNPDGTGVLLGKEIYELPLVEHDSLDGAYWFGWSEMEDNVAYQTNKNYSPTLTNYPLVNIKSKIYTSEVNNPFVFPVTGINSVGQGIVMSICSAAKALSQGQFGQFPLYAFSSEGVWALEVSSNGTFSAKQPITRDVCINTKSITQLDSAVLFATDRGIMMLSGSQAECITDAINDEQPFNVLTLPHMGELHTLVGHSADTCFPTAPFLTFLADCAMLYDYVHQHVIVYNPAYTYAYVFSLKSKQWGMIYSNIASGVNSYPDALAMTNDHKLVSFSQASVPGGSVAGLFVTRPLKLGLPDTLKTINTVIVRGMFQRGDVKVVLYGSRDLYNWVVIWSSTTHELRGFSGTPYKYFRIACVANLSQDKSIQGASIQFTPRQTNRLR